MHELTITLLDRDQVRLTGPAGVASVFFRNPWTPEQAETLRWLLEDCSRLAIGPERNRQIEAVSAVDDLGVALFRALSATPESATLLRPVVESPEKYAVRVVSDDAGFLALPWELLRPPGATSGSLAWARELIRCRAARKHGRSVATGSSATGPLRVLLVSPRPLGAADVRPRTVRGPLLRAAELTRGAVEVDLLRPATFEQLQAVLADRDGYDILHFDGHGYAGTDATGAGTLTSGVVFEDEEGRARLVSADEFASVVPAGRIPLIVLNACRSAYHEVSTVSGPVEVDNGSSVASALLSRGAGAVLAMTHTVDASVVATFMTHFYDGLSAGSTLAAAVSDGRHALLTDPDDGREQAPPFHIIPVLYEQQTVELRAPVSSTHEPQAGPHDPEPTSVHALMYRDGELADIDRHLQDASPVVVHGPVASGKSVLLRAYARYALLTRGFDHVVFTTGEQLAADESLLLHRVRHTAQAFASRPVLHVWDGVDQYVDLCSEAVRALPSEHRVLMSARYDSFPLPHYSHATRELPDDLLSDMLVRALTDTMLENPDFTLDGLQLTWLIWSTGWHGGTLAAILRAWQSIPLADILRRLELGFPVGGDDPLLDPAVRRCLADLPAPLLEELSYLGLYGYKILPSVVASFTDRSDAEDDLFGTTTGTHISLDRWEELLDRAHRAGMLSPLHDASKTVYQMSPLVSYALRGELTRRFSPEQLRILQRGANISVAHTLLNVFSGITEGTIYTQRQMRHLFSMHMDTNVRIAMLRAIDQADYDLAAAVASAYTEDVPAGSPGWQTALEVLTQIFQLCRDQLESDPNSQRLAFVLHEAIAKAATLRSDWNQAMTHLEQVLAFSDDPVACEDKLPLLLWRADITLRMGDRNLFKAALADAVRHASAEANEDALDECRTRLEEFITDFHLRPPAAGQLAREVGLPDMADDRQPANVDDSAARRADTLLRELREAELDGQLSAAAGLRRALGVTAREAGDSEEARRWLTSAVELERSSSGIGDLAATAYQLAFLEEEADNLDNAASWYQVVLDLPSASALQKAHAHRELGIIEFKRNRDDDALRAFDAARRHYSAQEMHTFTAVVDELAAQTLRRKGDLAGAIELGESVVRTMMKSESDERIVESLMSLAHTLRDIGDVQEATAHLLRLLSAAGDRGLVLAEKFILLAAGTPPDIEVLQSQVDGLGRPTKLVGPGLLGWAKEANCVLDSLDLGTVLHSETTRPMYQQMLWQLAHKTRWFETEDDYPALMEVKARTLDGLAQACQTAPPRPGELARWLVDLRIDQADSATAVELSEIVELLDTQELEDYRRRLEELHRNLPVVDDEDDEAEPQATLRWKIRDLREEFLRAVESDVEVLLAFFAEDVSNPERHIRIAEELQSLGRFEEAISWLERADPKHLRRSTLLAELYTATGSYREAVGMRWQAFEIFPSRWNYERLLEAAEPLDAVEYARHRVVNHIRTLNDDSASDAIDVLMQEATVAINQRRNYRQAASLMIEIRRLSRRRRDFTRAIERFKTEHRQHADLVAALAEVGL